MISFYINIPFCDVKCKYCNFFVVPTENLSTKDDFISRYVENMCQEILSWKERVNNESIKTIYFGGGTPSHIGYENIKKIINLIFENFNVEDLEELSIELNPYPEVEILEFVKKINQQYRGLPRLRFSFGIQSFDSEVLQKSGRNYSFGAIVDFLRSLQKIKQDNNIFNLDFIAFGKFNYSKKGNKMLRDEVRLQFFQSLVESLFADSFSIYTLELFQGSERFNKNGKIETLPTFVDKKDGKINGLFDVKEGESMDDLIYEEFEILKSIVLDSGYTRYELSNFALAGKSSLHNRVYREMESYIGIGAAASSFIKNGNIETLKDGKINGGDDLYKNISNMFPSFHSSIFQSSYGLRFTNTISLLDYAAGKYLDPSKTLVMTEEDYLIEKFFLALRTDAGVLDLEEFSKVLVNNFQKKLEKYQDDGFVFLEGNRLKLTDQGMDVYNSIVTEILEKI